MNLEIGPRPQINKSIQSAFPHAHATMMTAFTLEGKVNVALADGSEKVFTSRRISTLYWNISRPRFPLGILEARISPFFQDRTPFLEN